MKAAMKVVIANAKQQMQTLTMTQMHPSVSMQMTMRRPVLRMRMNSSTVQSMSQHVIGFQVGNIVIFVKLTFQTNSFAWYLSGLMMLKNGLKKNSLCHTLSCYGPCQFAEVVEAKVSLVKTAHSYDYLVSQSHKHISHIHSSEKCNMHLCELLQFFFQMFQYKKLSLELC